MVGPNEGTGASAFFRIYVLQVRRAESIAGSDRSGSARDRGCRKATDSDQRGGNVGDSEYRGFGFGVRPVAVHESRTVGKRGAGSFVRT